MGVEEKGREGGNQIGEKESMNKVELMMDQTRSGMFGYRQQVVHHRR